jgi:hypothetical protein
MSEEPTSDLPKSLQSAKSEMSSFTESCSPEYEACTDPFSVYQRTLANVRPRAVGWLWQKRLALAGITLLDGDHGCGKSLLALEIAARVSSGSPMPDGTPTIQGDVIIVSPNTDSKTAQLQRLIALGADLPHIHSLTFIHDSETSPYRPFSLPQDLPRLLKAAERVDARLIILDPFIQLLSQNHRLTELSLDHLLADLNQQLIAHNSACLLVRNCPAKGGQAKPSLLERSDCFVCIATSRLLLCPDPMQPDRLLLSHAISRHTALTPTLLLQIQPHPGNPNVAHCAHLGSHSLKARDLMDYTPDTLHRRLLFQQLLELITNSTDPVEVSTLSARFPHSSPFQIQRALKDLYNTELVERSANGFYVASFPSR